MVSKALLMCASLFASFSASISVHPMEEPAQLTMDLAGLGAMSRVLWLESKAADKSNAVDTAAVCLVPKAAYLYHRLTKSSRASTRRWRSKWTRLSCITKQQVTRMLSKTKTPRTSSFPLFSVGLHKPAYSSWTWPRKRVFTSRQLGIILWEISRCSAKQLMFVKVLLILSLRVFLLTSLTGLREPIREYLAGVCRQHNSHQEPAEVVFCQRCIRFWGGSSGPQKPGLGNGSVFSH